jgi:hypothetical protein
MIINNVPMVYSYNHKYTDYVSTAIPVNHQFTDEVNNLLSAKQDVQRINQLQAIISRMNADAKLNIPYFINNCNYVASLSRHNYMYAPGVHR